MADKKVSVVIDGQETVTDATAKADGALSGFAGKAGSMLKGLAAVAAGLALGDYFRGAIEEAQKSRDVMESLSTTVRNAGGSWDTFGPKVDQVIANLVRFSVYADDDLASALQSMILRTGDADWSLQNLAQAADLAAAAGIPLESAAEMLAKAHEGQTKALFRLIPELKGASDWQGMLAEKTAGAAAAQERARGPLAQIAKQWGEVQEAVGKAILGNSELTASGNSVADMLADLAVWIEHNGGSFTSLITVTAQVARTFSGVFGPAAKVLATVILALTAGIEQVWYWISNLAYTTERTVGSMLRSFGTLLEKGGAFLKVFGIDVVSSTADSIKAVGEEMVGRSSNILLRLQVQHDEGARTLANTWNGLWSTVKTASSSAADNVTLSQNRLGDAAKAASLTAKEAADAYYQAASAKLGKPLADMIGLTTKAITDLGEAGKQQLDPNVAAEFARHMGALKEQAGAASERLAAMSQSTRNAKSDSKDLATDIGTIARAAVDAASAFGVMDAKSTAVLQSVISMSVALAKLTSGTGTTGDIVSVIAALVNIISTVIGGDAARKRLITENTDAMDRLRRELGNLSLDVTGDTFAKVQSALGEVLPQLKGGRGAANQADVLNALARRGLSFSDLKKIAEQLGIRIVSDSGALSVDGLKQLFEAMGLVELGQFGKDFGSQLSALNTGFGINKTSERDQLKQLGDLGGQFSSALAGVINLSDLAGSRERLRQLFMRMNAGGISANELGGLTGEQFLSFLTNAIGRIDTLLGAGSDASAPAADSPGPSASDGNAGAGSGSGSVAPETVQTVVRAMDANLAGLLTAQTALHARVADATEESARRLASIDDKMDALIAATAGRADRLDAELEDARYRLGVQYGQTVTFA